MEHNKDPNAIMCVISICVHGKTPSQQNLLWNMFLLTGPPGGASSAVDWGVLLTGAVVWGDAFHCWLWSRRWRRETAQCSTSSSTISLQEKSSNVGSHVILEIVNPQWPTPVGYCGGGFSVCAPFGVSVGYCVGHCRRPQSGSLRPYVSICKHMCTYGSCFLKDSCSKHPTNLPLTQSPLRAVPVIGKCEQGRRAQRKTVIGGDWKPPYPLQGDWDIWCYIYLSKIPQQLQWGVPAKFRCVFFRLFCFF